MEFPFESFSIIFEISDACHLNEFYHEVVLHINTCIFCLFVCLFSRKYHPSVSTVWYQQDMGSQSVQKEESGHEIIGLCKVRTRGLFPIKISSQSNFQSSVKSDLGWHWFYRLTLRDWARKFAPSCQPIRCQLKLITTWSPAFFRALDCFAAITLSSHRVLFFISLRTNFIYGCIIPRELVAFSDPTPDGKRLANSYAGTSQFLVFRQFKEDVPEFTIFANF